MKKFTKILSLLLVSVMIIGMLAACGSGSNANKTVKIGVLVADVSGEEALGFADYYKNYIAKNYNVEFSYSAIVIVITLALIIYLFDHTKFGFDYAALKNGQKVAVNTGVKEIPNALICYAICGALMGVVGFLNAARSTSINGGSLNFGSIAIMFTAFLPMFIGGYIGRFSNEKLGFLLAALCMSMLNSTFAAFSNEISASMQSIINAVLLVVFLIYLSNEHKLSALLRPIRKQK